MKIVVCVKETVDTAASLSIIDGAVNWGEAALVLNPWDEFAVEEALLLREKHGGEVIAVSVGGSNPNEALKIALAMGVDQAILIQAPAFDGLQSLQTAFVLARVIEKTADVDLVLFGRQSVDNESGVLPAQVARCLRWPALTQTQRIVSLDVDGASIKVQRSLDEGTATTAASLPAVVSVVKGINEPRYPSFMGIRKAARAKVPVWDQAELAPLQLPAVSLTAGTLSEPARRASQLEMLEADGPEALAKLLLDRLSGEKVI